jgi:hypothetical protein
MDNDDNGNLRVDNLLSLLLGHLQSIPKCVQEPVGDEMENEARG